LLADELVVLGVCPNLEPADATFNISAERTIVLTDSDGPELADALEMQRGVT
jgi:hypothetical protein